MSEGYTLVERLDPGTSYTKTMFVEKVRFTTTSLSGRETIKFFDTLSRADRDASLSSSDVTI